MPEMFMKWVLEKLRGCGHCSCIDFAPAEGNLLQIRRAFRADRKRPRSVPIPCTEILESR
jgi:hypothetical protein